MPPLDHVELQFVDVLMDLTEQGTSPGVYYVAASNAT